MKNFFFILLSTSIMVACTPAAPIINAAPEISVISKIPPTPTVEPSPTNTPEPKATGNERADSLQKLVGVQMVESEDGKFFYFKGDKEQRYQMPVDAKKYDQFTWQINGKDAVLQNVTPDIQNKGFDSKGNKVFWVQGFSGTVDKKTGEIVWGVVDEGIPTGSEIVKDKNPWNTRYEPNDPRDAIALQNMIYYQDAIEELYPPENLYPTAEEAKADGMNIMIGNYEVIENAAARKNTRLYTAFFPQSADPKYGLQYLYSLNSGSTGKYAGKYTGKYSPYQLQGEHGVMYSPMPTKYDKDGKEWGAIVMQMYIYDPNNKDKYTRISTFEDETMQDGSGRTVTEMYSKYLKAVNGILPVLIPNYSKKIKDTPLESQRLGEWVFDEIKKRPLNFSEYRTSGTISIFEYFPSNHKYITKKLPDKMDLTPFILYINQAIQ